MVSTEAGLKSLAILPRRHVSHLGTHRERRGREHTGSLHATQEVSLYAKLGNEITYQDITLLALAFSVEAASTLVVFVLCGRSTSSSRFELCVNVPRHHASHPGIRRERPIRVHTGNPHAWQGVSTIATSKRPNFSPRGHASRQRRSHQPGGKDRQHMKAHWTFELSNETSSRGLGTLTMSRTGIATA